MSQFDVEALPLDPPTCSLRKESAGREGSHCHAVRYRLNFCSVDQLRCNFDALVCELHAREKSEEIADVKLWEEAIGWSAGAAISVQRRQIELTRPVQHSPGAAWRAVMLEYEEGILDLILVARRSAMDSASLQLLASAIISGPPAGEKSINPEAASGPQAQWGEELPEDSPLDVNWGMGKGELGGRDILRFDFPAGTRVDLPALIAAVGITAARYAGANLCLVATLAQQPGRSPGRLGAFEALALISVSAHESMPGRQVVSQVEEALAVPTCWDSEEIKTLLKTKYGRNAAVAIGVFAAELPEHPTYSKPDEYLPFLAPPYPLTIYLRSDSSQSQSIECSYATDIFDKTIVAQFAQSSGRLAGTLRAASTLSQLELLSAGEREAVAGLGRSARMPAPHLRLNQAFADIVRQYPSRTALVFGEERISYRELGVRVNRAAQVLRACGVRNGQRVGVCVERSLELVVSILAVTEAGAAYVPIDTEYPLERLAYIATDALVNVVVTSRRDFPETNQARILSPADLALPETEHKPELSVEAGAEDDIAYIIYTSGSTGRPKGVAVPHRNVMGLMAATKNDFGLAKQDVWTLFHASSFDFSVWELWGCLLTGGSLVIVPFATSRTPLEFQELLSREGVTILNQTPSAFAQLIDADHDRPLPLSLRLIIFGGEPLNARMLLPWLDRWPESCCRLVNMFGITETTVHVTSKTVTRDEALQASRSVGRPILGWHIYVMDTAGRLLPPGVSGEICVGGQGVAEFYLNKPGLTGARFVPDPYAPGRLYCSGDKGRWRPDGELEHLGRIDSQVKIRGFRIEIDEVRAVLLDTPGVTAAAVVFRQEDPKDAACARLDAYVAADCSANDVRRHISLMLPDYMLPATVTVLASLPLTANGKLDVSGLPKPARVPQAMPVAGRAAPSDSANLAHVLRGIWQTVLKVPVELDDNFFDLGGNSLYAVRIGAVMREQRLPPIALRDIYVHQTVRKIADVMHRKEERA